MSVPRGDVPSGAGQLYLPGGGVYLPGGVSDKGWGFAFQGEGLYLPRGVPEGNFDQAHPPPELNWDQACPTPRRDLGPGIPTLTHPHPGHPMTRHTPSSNNRYILVKTLPFCNFISGW